MRCLNCNSEVNEGVNFCPYCGHPIGVSHNKQYHFQQNSSSPSNKKLAEFILIAVAIFFGLFFLGNCDACEDSTNYENEYEQTSSSNDEFDLDIDALEFRIEVDYDIEHVKITHYDVIGRNPYKISFRYDFDAEWALERIYNAYGTCIFYDDGDIRDIKLQGNINDMRKIFNNLFTQ